ncbi:thioredoxin domain-containing protein 9 homolog [Benincasa hispida]|uniref:thioredoxin domain-containing protein 9 homolog n=1 Tax=Benincasa hispida TaxID=102211 RepID=UPI00190162D2|nr:thioredoxin domain-containing protein 9 homolog [Benincasa hispida]
MQTQKLQTQDDLDPIATVDLEIPKTQELPEVDEVEEDTKTEIEKEEDEVKEDVETDKEKEQAEVEEVEKEEKSERQREREIYEVDEDAETEIEKETDEVEEDVETAKEEEEVEVEEEVEIAAPPLKMRVMSKSKVKLVDQQRAEEWNFLQVVFSTENTGRVLKYTVATGETTVMDKHLSILAKQHIETCFVKINAEKSPFLAEKLKIVVLSTLALIKNAKVDDYVVGFDELGGTDEFNTEELEDGLAKCQVIFHQDESSINASKSSAQTRRSVRQNTRSDSSNSE